MSAQKTDIRVEHEIHRRRRSRNVGLGLVLGAFVFLIMGITYVKLTTQNAERAEKIRAEEAAAQGTETSTTKKGSN